MFNRKKKPDPEQAKQKWIRKEFIDRIPSPGYVTDKSTMKPASIYLLRLEQSSNSIDDKVAVHDVHGNKQYHDAYFSYSSGLNTKNYILKQSYLEIAEPDNPLIEIPLEKIGATTKIRDEKHPVQVLGIKGKKEKKPLVLVKKERNGFSYLGLYVDNKGVVKTYQHRMLHAENNMIGSLLFFDESYKNTDTKEENAIYKDPEPEIICPAIINKDKSSEDIKWEDPKSIIRYLDKYIIKQDAAKRILAVAVSNYMLKKEKDAHIDHYNVQLIGPSGVGKSTMANLLAKKAKIPFINTSASTKSDEGLVGENFSSIFYPLAMQTKEEDPFAIMLIDEVDKLITKTELMNSLVAWSDENGSIAMKINKGNTTKYMRLHNILFIIAGAFDANSSTPSLEQIIMKREGTGQKKIGFDTAAASTSDEDKYNTLLRVTPEDLINYGLKAELVGRFSARAVLQHLTLQDKTNILNNSEKSVLKNFKKIFEHKNYSLDVDYTATVEIARNCPDKTGARDLNEVCFKAFSKIVLEPEKYADSKKRIRVTDELIRDLLKT